MLYRYLNVVYSDLESLANALVAQGHTQPVDILYRPTDTIADVIVIPVVESATEQAERLAQKLHQPVQARARFLERYLGCQPDQNLVQILSTK